MSRVVMFWILFGVTTGYAVWRGDRDSRVVAFICLAAVALSRQADNPLNNRFASVETGLMIVDLAALAGFTAIALVSDRFWPLWVAGLQLTTVVGHVLKSIDGGLNPRAYGLALIFWSYPILVIVMVGAWRSYRRRLAAQDRHAALV